MLSGEDKENARRRKLHRQTMERSDKVYKVPGSVSTVVPGMESGRSISPKRYEERKRAEGWTGR